MTYLIKKRWNPIHNDRFEDIENVKMLMLDNL